MSVLDHSSPIPSRHIVQLLTWGVGISEWEELKIADREVQLFYKYREFDCSVTIVSTSRNDFQKSNEIRENYPEFNFIFLEPKILGSIRNLLKSAPGREIIKVYESCPDRIVVRSSQLLGSHVAFGLYYHLKCKVIVRQGFNMVDNVRKEGKSKLKQKLYLTYEKLISKSFKIWEHTTQESVKSTTQRNSKIDFKSVVIPNFVDEKIWDSNRRKLRPLDKIGFFGRFSQEKNLENLLVAAKRAGEINIVFIGESDLELDLKRKAEQLGLRIKFLPRMHPSDLVDETSNWKYAIFPSLYEGNPKAVLEMFAMRIPVLGTPVQGIMNLIIDGETGFLAQGVSVDDLTRLLLRTKTISQSEIDKVTENAFRFFQLNNSLDAVVQAQLDFYFGED
jgi:glycosyltransferase involved in cell wall biosynthesis